MNMDNPAETPEKRPCWLSRFGTRLNSSEARISACAVLEAKQGN